MATKIKRCESENEDDESLNIEMTGNAENWDPDATPKGAAAAGGVAGLAIKIEEKLKKKLEEYEEFLIDLLEEANKPVFRCLLTSWVNKKKIKALAKKMAKEIINRRKAKEMAKNK